jgi:hypothetical protein
VSESKAGVGRNSLVALLAAVALVASIWYLQAPPRTEKAYAERAAATADALRSHVQSDRLWIGALEDGRTTRQAATVAFEEAEADAHSTAARFSGWDPPAGAGADELRADLVELASAATSALSAVRIAAHRGEWEDLRRFDAPLERLAARLDELARRTAT